MNNLAVAFARVSIIAFSFAMIPEPTSAQTVPVGASGDQLDDIVVTARKIGEASQSLPITVNAFSGAELTNKAILNVQDLQAITPGLTISANQTGGNPIFAIRGTSTDLGVDGGVALYFNDVPLVSTFGIVNAFYDISSVEVLKGPQGTQFGTNTTGGTITVRSNLPTPQFEGYAKVGYGNFDRRELEGVINIPVSDALGFRFAGNYLKRDGYVKNPIAAGGVPSRFADDNHYSMRGTMKIASGPVENVTILDYYDRDETPAATIAVAFRPDAANGINLPALGSRAGDRDTIYVGAESSGQIRNRFGRAKLFGAQNTLNIDFSDQLSLRNVVGYRHDQTTVSEDTSGQTLTMTDIYNDTRVSQWNDDFTLRYKLFDDRLRLNLGGYYQITKKRQGINANVAQSIFLAFFNQPLVVSIRTFERKRFESKAAYFNGDFDITDSLGISAGFRYNWDSASSQVSAAQAAGILPIFGAEFFPDSQVPCAPPYLSGYQDRNPAACSARRSATFRAPSYNLVVTKTFSPDVLAYGKISHGYLAGGTNFTIREVPIYQPEKTTMIEAGLKADWRIGGRPIRTNVAIYRGRTNDKQVNYNAAYDDSSQGFGVFNAAKMTVYGVDLEMRISPFRGATIDASYNYIHAKFDRFEFPGLGGNGDGQTGATLVPPVNLSGATPAQTPKHQANVAVSYEWPMNPAMGKITSTLSGYYTSAIAQANVFSDYNRSFGEQFNRLDGYFLANGSINWRNIAGSPISAQMWMRNILDKNYLVFRNTQFQVSGYATAIYGAPRTYGISATMEF